MKKILFLALLLVPAFVFSKKVINYKKYLSGAVPVVNGMVTFEKSLSFPGMSKTQIFEKAMQYVNGVIEVSEHPDYSRVTSQSSDDGTIAASITEYMYFKKKKWETDFCHFRYQFLVECTDGKAGIKIQRLSYIYDEERNADNANFSAEGWITDDNALKTGGKELKKAPGKFRMATIDRMEQLLSEIEACIKGK